MFEQWIICGLICIGTSANDALCCIRNRENETLDKIIQIHEKLCTVVSNTVSTYKWWFLLHWFSYGAVVILSLIYLSTENISGTLTTNDTLKLVHLCVIFICHVYLFLVPCIFAARITSCCTGKNLLIVRSRVHIIITLVRSPFTIFQLSIMHSVCPPNFA